MARTVKNLNTALASTKKPVSLSDFSGKTAGDGLQNVVAGLGTERDKRSGSHWGIPRQLTRFELENMYRGSWLAKRIVNTKADDMTRAWRTVKFDDADTNDRLQAVTDEEKKLKVQSKFNEAIRWANLYGGCLIVMGINNDDPSKPLVPETLKKGCLKSLHVLDRWRCSPNGSLTKDLGSPNFGLPESYLLAESSVEVHHTRVLRFNGEKLPYFSWLANAMWDDSALQHVVDALSDCDATTAGIATMVFEANVDVVKSKGMTQLLTQKDGEAKLIKRFQLSQLMKSYNRTLLLDGEEEYEKKQNQFANLDKIALMMQINACGGSDIPMTRLFGQSASGLNATGDGDIRNYYDMVGAKQQSEVRPQLDQFDQVFLRHTLGQIPKGYDYEFDSLWQTDDSEQATIDYANAQRDQIYVTMGVATEGLIASELKARGTYRSMSADDVQLAVELSEAAKDTGGEVAEPGTTESGKTAPAAGKKPGTAKAPAAGKKPGTAKAPAAPGFELHIKTSGGGTSASTPPGEI